VEDEANLDKQNPHYIQGNEEGAALGIKFKTGLITEDELNENLDDSSYVDTGYKEAKTQGAQAGKFAALQENYYEQIPTPYEDVSAETGDIPQEIKDVYYESYWKTRDSKAGEIEGLKAAASEGQEDDYAIKDLYVVLEDNTSKTEKGKRGVRYADIFENSFVNAREAGKINGNAEELLQEKQGEEVENIQTRDQKIEQKAIEVAIKDAQDKSQPKEPSQDYRAAMGLKASMTHENTVSKELELSYIDHYWAARDEKAGEIQGIQMVLDAQKGRHAKAEDYADPLDTLVVKEAENEGSNGGSMMTDKLTDVSSADSRTIGGKRKGIGADSSASKTIGGGKGGSLDSPISDRVDTDNPMSIHYVYKPTKKGYHNKEWFDIAFEEGRKKAEKIQEDKNALQHLAWEAKTANAADAAEHIQKKKGEEIDVIYKKAFEEAERQASKAALEGAYFIAAEEMGVKEKLEELKNSGQLEQKHPRLYELMGLKGKDNGDTNINAKGIGGGVQEKEEEGGFFGFSMSSIVDTIKDFLSPDKIHERIRQALEGVELEGEYEGDEERGMIGEDDFRFRGEVSYKVGYNDMGMMQKAIISTNYNKIFEQQKNAAKMQATTDLTEVFMFNDTGDLSTSNTVGEGSSDSEQEEGANDAVQDLADALNKEEEKNTDVRDVRFNTLPIIKVFQEQEQLIETTQGKVASIRNRVWDLDDELFRIEDTLLTGDNRLAEVNKEIDTLNAQKPLKVAQQKELRSLKLEKKALEKDKKKGDTNVSRLTEELNREKGYISDTALDIDNFLKNRLKFRTRAGADTTNEILDYLDVFIERLQVTGQFGYNETGVKLNGGGVLIVEKNAEDVYTGTSVIVSKGDFTFKASGLEYNEDKNRLILSGGSAVIPKLEGAKNSRDKANYDFDGLSFDLNQGVFLQLKLQQGKLRAGAVPMSTGTRSAAPQQEKLNPSVPQNTPTKTDTTT
jgi:hypothetical protein